MANIPAISGAHNDDARNILNLTIETVNTMDGSVTKTKADIDNFINGTGVVTRQHLVAGSIDNSKLADDSIQPQNIVNNGVREENLAGNAVSTIKIVDAAVTNPKLADDAVHPRNIVTNGVREENLAGNSVTEIKIIDKAVTAPKISDSAITERTLNTSINSRTYNSNYKIGVDFGTCFFDGYVIDMNIKELRVFLKSGETQLSLSDLNFSLDRNTTLYIDMSETTPTVKIANNPPQSGTEFGNGGFFEDRKILLLSNFYGVFTGILADSFKQALESTADEKILAQKTSSDIYHIYMQSKRNTRKYARYEIKNEVKPYSSTDEKSNVNVHEINGVKMMNRETDETFTDLGDIATGGAWSCAIRESSVTDSVGGIAHGDEIESYCNVILNGVKSAMPSDLRVYDEVEFIAASTLYKDSGKYTDLQEMGKHFKSFKFARDDGMIIDSKVIMESSQELVFVYLGMASILKDFTNKAITDIDLSVNDLLSDAPVHEKRKGINRIDVYGDEVYFKTEVLERESPSSHNAKVEKISYNKVYYDLIEDYFNTSDGDVYRQRTKYEVGIL